MSQRRLAVGEADAVLVEVRRSVGDEMEKEQGHEKDRRWCKGNPLAPLVAGGTVLPLNRLRSGVDRNVSDRARPGPRLFG